MKNKNICQGCNKEKYIENKHFKLCFTCNKNRLRSKPKKKINKINEDNIFYEKCFNSCKTHECEECKKPLPEIFKGVNGNILARWRYSHIIPKSIEPKLRHVLKNINHLCLKCHSRWDHGDKESMNIYAKNKERFPWYF